MLALKHRDYGNTGLPYEAGFRVHRSLSTDDDDDSATTFQDSAMLRDTFIIYGSIFVVAFLAFCYARQRYPKVYNIRNWVDGLKTHLAEDQFGYFSWLWKVYAIPEEEIFDECGLDAVSYLRLVCVGVKLSILGVFNSIYLIPTYYTSEESSETDYIDDGVVETTIANVPSGSNRMFATLFASYIFFGYLLWLILQEFRWYIAIRHKYLRQPMAQHFAVYVRNVPPEYQDNQNLANYFQNCFSEEEVLEARLTLNIANLEKTVANREKTLGKLEHAHAIQQTTGARPEHREKQGQKRCCGDTIKVDTIDAFTKLLEEQNKDVAAQINALQAVASGSMRPQTGGVDSQQRVGSETASTEEAKGLLQRNIAQAASLITGQEGQPHASGFVVFRSLSTTNAALQMLHSPRPFVMETIPAPDPKDVFWGNVGRSHKDLQIGLLGSFVLTTGLCLVWTIPMTFFASLSNADAVRQDVDWLDDLFNDYPGLIPFVEQLAPFLVVISNALLPLILKYFTLLEGPISTGVVESSRFVKLAIFQIVQTFFVSAISGSVFQAIPALIDDWTEIIDLLANSLPAQGTYFQQIVLISTIIGSSIETLRIAPLITSSLRTCFGPRLTEKERSKTAFGLRPLSDPPYFVHAVKTAQLVLFYMILFVYAVISPITPIITGVCFLYIGAAMKHQFVYIYPKHPDTGGKLWSGFLQIILSCAVIAQLTILGLLGLKKGVKQVPFFIPLICITILFNIYIRQMHFRTAAYLPTHECWEEDQHRDPGFDFSFVKRAYIQPALKAPEEIAPDPSLLVPPSRLPDKLSDGNVGSHDENGQCIEEQLAEPQDVGVRESESTMLHRSDEGIKNT